MISRDAEPRPGLLFPGQGAQAVGMGRAVYDSSPAARLVFERADAALGYPLSRLCFDGPAAELRQTRRQQPAILACSLALLAARDERDGPWTPAVASGHSLGLYSALVAAGALALDDALHLVARRGELMQQAADARPGGMAAVLGLDDAAVEEVCAEVSRDGGIVVAANYNAPGQAVISGTTEAIKHAAAQLRARGARKTVPLAVAGAFHSPLMQAATEALVPALRTAAMATPRWPIVANTAPRVLRDAADIREELIAQVAAPVRWTEAVCYMASLGATPFVDCGPGTTLAALVKRIVPGASIVELDIRSRQPLATT